MRAVGFGKSTEGPAKEAGFSEVDPGPLNPRGMLPLLYWALDEKLWGCLTGHISYHMVWLQAAHAVLRAGFARALSS